MPWETPPTLSGVSEPTAPFWTVVGGQGGGHHVLGPLLFLTVSPPRALGTPGCDDLPPMDHSLGACLHVVCSQTRISPLPKEEVRGALTPARWPSLTPCFSESHLVL